MPRKKQKPPPQPGASYPQLAPEPKLTRRQASYFASVEAAREALRVRSYELLKLYIHNIKMAMRAGDHETAMKALQWLGEHAPPDANGLRVFDVSIDKPREEKKATGPTINFGFNLGGVTPTKGLPEAPTVTVEVVEAPTEKEEPKE